MAYIDVGVIRNQGLEAEWNKSLALRMIDKQEKVLTILKICAFFFQNLLIRRLSSNVNESNFSLWKWRKYEWCFQEILKCIIVELFKTLNAVHRVRILNKDFDPLKNFWLMTAFLEENFVNQFRFFLLKNRIFSGAVRSEKINYNKLFFKISTGHVDGIACMHFLRCLSWAVFSARITRISVLSFHLLSSDLTYFCKNWWWITNFVGVRFFRMT